jgi:putative membrane protein insertion efficiency factor
MAARAATGLIGGYQRYISPFLGPRCRFHPTCSTYAGQAIMRFGVVRGSWLMLCRIVRCHPLCEGGFDPVPRQFNWWHRDVNEPE